MFSCTKGKESNKWVENIWNVQELVIKEQEMQDMSAIWKEYHCDTKRYNNGYKR